MDRGNEAARSTENGTIEALVSTSLALMASDRDTGALLAAEAYRRWPTDPRTRVALMDAMTAGPGYVGRSHVSDTERNQATSSLVPAPPSSSATAPAQESSTSTPAPSLLSSTRCPTDQ